MNNCTRKTFPDGIELVKVVKEDLENNLVDEFRWEVWLVLRWPERQTLWSHKLEASVKVSLKQRTTDRRWYEERSRMAGKPTAPLFRWPQSMLPTAA